MTPDVTYDDVRGTKDALEKLREVVELPLLHPERFVNLGIDPPKGVWLYGPPRTGKSLKPHRCMFHSSYWSGLVQKYVVKVREWCKNFVMMARFKKACIVFFDEVDAMVELVAVPRKEIPTMKCSVQSYYC
ncbi:hypothetical protein PsorP6_002421 [Peronosclerospora sorghi]|uniref:Uncharacterized protein n=1 Tax=Peronosclerospora sorghi TaxID=230839 RepID=A0ACC0WQ35_9STRA|nr:hypothetical protein PsorP6_002421 [Peronosclerospora sorghi]